MSSSTPMTVAAPVSAVERALQAVDQQRDGWHVPGLELAVVRDGATLFAGGLGVRGVDDPAPVTSATLFHHGSCGKAYTGLLAAVLSAEGVVDLDAPVRRLVPELRLPDQFLADRITIRDLVSHRSGLGRHDFAWILNPSWSREELVRRLEHLPLAGDLRAQIAYSNFGFTLAGLALGRAVGTSYEEALRTRVLEPLAMRRTFAGSDEALRDADHATPHNVRHDKAATAQWRIMQGIAPAGEILSCADDSVRWLNAQLGLADGVDSEAIAAAQQPQMLGYAGASSIPEMQFFAYAMGWLVGAYRGRRLLWHNGGVDGFTTQTLLLLDERIGVVACANQLLTQFPLAAVLLVVDELLGLDAGEQTWFDRLRSPAEVPEQPVATDAPAPPHAHPPADYAGSYRNLGYGDLVVTADPDLAVRFGEADLTAKHRHYETWDLRYDPLDTEFAATFWTDAAGAVTAVVAELEPGSQVRFERVG